MKRTVNSILAAILCCLILGGCALGIATATPPTDPPADAGMTEPTVPPDNSAAYEAIITGLRQELEALRAEQESQNAADRQTIAELQATLNALTVLSPVPSPEPAPTSQFTYTELPNGLMITGYTGNDVSVTIPAAINGRPVLGIADSAFQNSRLEQVVLSEGIQSIGWFAFSGSYALSSVVLPASVSSIAYAAFELCSSSLRISAPPASYAAAYAASYGIPVIGR